MVQGARPEHTDRLARLVGALHGAAWCGQPVGRAVKVQQDEATRRPAQVVHAGDGLLAPVAALVEVDGPLEQPDLVGDRAVVGVDAEARRARRDAQGLPGPRACRAAVPLGPRGHRVARLDGPSRAPAVLLGGVQPHDGVGRGDVGDLDPRHEPHAVQERDERRAGAGLGVRPEGGAVVDTLERVLDAALRGEHESLGGRPRLEPLEVLGREGVQPGEPVGAGDREHVPVREVDEAVTLLETTLLDGELAVVGRDAVVGSVGLDGTLEVEQGAAAPRRGEVVRCGGLGLRLRHGRASPRGATAWSGPRPPCRSRTSASRRPSRTCAGRRCTPRPTGCGRRCRSRA